MKKVIILLLAAVMTLLFACCSPAAVISFDYPVNATEIFGLESSGGDISYPDLDLSTRCIGIDLPFAESWKAALQYYTGETKFDGEKIWDNHVYGIKGGYALLNNDQTQLYITLGYFRSDRKFAMALSSAMSYDSMHCTAIPIGLDLSYQAADNFTLDTGVAYGCSPKYDIDGRKGNLGFLVLFNVKGTYFCADHWGVSLGYTYNTIGFKEHTVSIPLRFTQALFTLGVSYKF